MDIILSKKCCSLHKNIKGSTLDRFKIRCDLTNCSLLTKKFPGSQKKNQFLKAQYSRYCSILICFGSQKILENSEIFSKVQLFGFPARLVICTVTTNHYKRNKTMFHLCPDWSIWIGSCASNMTTQVLINRFHLVFPCWYSTVACC